MKKVTQRREVATAAAIAAASTATAALAKEAGWDIVATFIASVGLAVTVGYIVLTNIAIHKTRSG